MAISDELLKILVCPDCKGVLRTSDAGDALVCDACGVSYPIEDDIPVLLREAAKRVE